MEENRAYVHYNGDELWVEVGSRRLRAQWHNAPPEMPIPDGWSRLLTRYPRVESHDLDVSEFSDIIVKDVF
jgi:hypothetical protein